MVKVKGRSGAEHDVYSFKDGRLEVKYNTLTESDILEAFIKMLDIEAKSIIIKLEGELKYSDRIRKMLELFNIKVEPYLP